jgi:hypothetical protein
MFHKFYHCIRFVCGRFNDDNTRVVARAANVVRGFRPEYPIIYFELNL